MKRIGWTVPLTQVWLNRDRIIWCNTNVFRSRGCLACQQGEMKLAHGTHAKLSKAPGLRCSVWMGVSVRGMGNQKTCQSTILNTNPLVLCFPLFRGLLFSISLNHTLSFSLTILSVWCYTQTLARTRTHTLLELNQKSMLSMVSQYLIKQSLCPSWQVMHFTALTHTSRHPDSLYLTHTCTHTHFNNHWKWHRVSFTSFCCEIWSLNSQGEIMSDHVFVCVCAYVRAYQSNARIDLSAWSSSVFWQD